MRNKMYWGFAALILLLLGVSAVLLLRHTDTELKVVYTALPEQPIKKLVLTPRPSMLRMLQATDTLTTDTLLSKVPFTARASPGVQLLQDFAQPAWSDISAADISESDISDMIAYTGSGNVALLPHKVEESDLLLPSDFYDMIKDVHIHGTVSVTLGEIEVPELPALPFLPLPDIFMN